MMLLAPLILAFGVPEEPIKLACALGYDNDAARSTRVTIALGGRQPVFEDADNLLGDEHGTVSPNRRGWSVKRSVRDGVATILLRSKVANTGHGAQVQLARGPEGRFAGRYYVNQGMLSESVAYGASGPIICDVVEGAAA